MPDLLGDHLATADMYSGTDEYVLVRSTRSTPSYPTYRAVRIWARRPSLSQIHFQLRFGQVVGRTEPVTGPMQNVQNS